MDLPITVVVKGKGKQILDKNSYVAAGGEGTVYQVGGTAYKIYHEPKKMIPIDKIKELQVLSHLANVLGPRDILLDTMNQPIGFTMPYILNTEFITRLFNKNFKNDNAITPNMIVELIKIMQNTMSEIHKCGIIVVDFNEMNSLTTNKFDNIFFIDVDSYQTPSFKATALMESVRDRIGPKGQFSEKTDWFSFAIVAFQMYMTYHPYQKGKYADYKPKDWSLRMDKNISIFHPDVVLADIWKDFSVIPAPHMAWFKEVFHNGVRSAPPLPDGAFIVGPAQPILITGNESFVVTKIFDYPDPIIGYYFLNGIMYILTKKAIFSGTRKLKDISHMPKALSMATVPGIEPILVVKSEGSVSFEDISGNPISTISVQQAMHYNGNIYSIHNNRMIENSFVYSGKKILHIPKPICNIFGSATKLYNGAAVQDILGKCWVAIPYQPGKCFNGPISELDGLRVIDAKFEHHVLMVIAEKSGQYNRYTICFDETMSKYTCRIEDNVNSTVISFTCLNNSICVHLVDDDSIELFRTNDKVKTVKNPPITTNMRLVNDSTGIIFINKNGLYSLKLK